MKGRRTRTLPLILVMLCAVVALPCAHASRASSLSLPIATPLYLVVDMEDQLQIAAVSMAQGAGPMASLIMNTNGDSLLVPLQLKIGNRSFAGDLDSAVDEMDPEVFGNTLNRIESVSDAPEGAMVMAITGRAVMARKFQTLFVQISAVLCERKSSAKEGCKPLYGNNYFYQFGLPEGASKTAFKSRRAKIWEALPEGELAGMIVEGLHGAIELVNLDFSNPGEEPPPFPRFRHALPQDFIVTVRLVEERGDRQILRLSGVGPLFSAETRIPPP